MQRSIFELDWRVISNIWCLIHRLLLIWAKGWPGLVRRNTLALRVWRFCARSPGAAAAPSGPLESWEPLGEEFKSNKIPCIAWLLSLRLKVRKLRWIFFALVGWKTIILKNCENFATTLSKIDFFLYVGQIFLWLLIVLLKHYSRR